MAAVYPIAPWPDKMEEFVVAGEKYGSGNLERKYRFSAENGNLERIGRKRETVATSVKQFFKVTFYGMHQCSHCTNFQL